MAALASVQDFRTWSGANLPQSVPDSLIADSLDEAEAAIVTEVGAAIDIILADPHSLSIARGDELRRCSRLLARRNSPEAIMGAGSEGVIAIPSRDPDSAAAVRQIRSLLLVPEGVS